MTHDPLVHVIDDDEAARDSLAFLLDCAGIPVRTHASAVDFLKVAPDITDGCIITDVRMPEMSGVELMGKLRQIGMTLPVIMITGHADVPLAIAAMKAGVADFIEKPFADDVILAAVRAALASREARDRQQLERDAILGKLATLSQREREVVDGLVEGRANKVIAYDLSISARTVEVYRANAMTKMGADSLSELVKMVMIARLAG